MKRLVLTLCMFCFWQVLEAQHEHFLNDRLQNLLESVLEENETADVEQLLSELQFAKEHPVVLQKAKADDFAVLFFLTQVQVEALLAYRDRYGPVLSAYELTAVDGFTPDLAELAGEFIDFNTDVTSLQRKFSRHELLIRGIRLLEGQQGFKTGKFEGSPEKLYLRYRYSSASIQLGYTGEKDAGERFLGKSNPGGFDFNSGFLRWQFGKSRSSVIVGDYVVQWGQGLVVWQGFAMGKSTEVDRIARFNQGIKAYSSTDENNYMRGVAGDFRLGKVQLYLFASYQPFDANTDSVGEQKVFTSIQTSGLHRTQSEIDDKNSVDVLASGVRLAYNWGSLQLGSQLAYTRYQLPLVRANDLYNRYLFDGQEISTASIDFRYTLNKLYWFGEFGGSSTGGLAALSGIQYQPVDQLAFSVLYRNLSRKYNSPWASTFTENSRANDEQGLYLGLKVFPAPRLSLFGYADFFQYKWIKYTTAAPAKGWEALLRVDYKLAAEWLVYGRYFFEGKMVKVSSGQAVRQNREQIRQSLRLQLSGQLSPCLSVLSRCERSFYKHENHSAGMFYSQDLQWVSPNETIRFDFRLAYFNTDDYDSRVYSYENDLLYQFSVPAFYNEGCRAYVNAKVKICEKIEFWMKCSRTWYFGAESIGSGDTAIDGNTRTELKLQLRIKI
ncbi:MAG: hypothetical protein ACK5JD_00975 [Mangrovibacterium sp.]